MADDPVNQRQFDADVEAAELAGNGKAFVDPDDPNGFKMPNPEDVWKLIQQMDGLSEEEREDLRRNIFSPQGGSPGDYLKQREAVIHSSRDYMVFLAMIVILVLVFALFGYKLFKSLKEKELKKQEKLKSKQSKKSKKTN